MAIRHEPIKPHIGARVDARRADLADAEFAAGCLELLETRNVVVFPEIGLSDAEQLAFTDLLGDRMSYVGQLSANDDDGIYKVSLDERIAFSREVVYATFFWHMDGFTADMDPPRATLLTARSVAQKGGQTEFANTYAAYELLPEADKAEIAGLRAIHSTFTGVRPALPQTVTPADWAMGGAEKEHPLVWNHADGRKSLIIGTPVDRIVGMDLPAGRALLARLLEWAVQPDLSYRHDWRVGDLVVWNNPGTLHRAIPYDVASDRLMHRTSIAGTEPVR